MSRCVSWRYVAEAGHDPAHRPGQCRVCWVPCRERVDHRGQQCTECLTALSMHPDTSIRLALAQSPGVDRDSLEMLATDLDIHVSLAAQAALDELDDEHNPSVSIDPNGSDYTKAVRLAGGQVTPLDDTGDGILDLFRFAQDQPSTVQAATLTDWLTEED